MRDGDGDRAGTGTEINDRWRVCVSSVQSVTLPQDRFDQNLSLRSRNQHRRADREIERPKLAAASEISQWLAAGTTLAPLVEALPLASREHAFSIDIEVATRET